MQKNNTKNDLPVIGVDIGGTKVSAGLVKDNRLVKSHTLPTPADKGPDEVLQTIVNTIKQLNAETFAGIGAGIPGLVDTQNGKVYDVQNIPGLSGMALRDKLQTAFNCPVEINNDANCFVLGVKNHDNGQPFKHLVGLTLGTGLGGGLILNGQLYEGVGTGAGEFGSLPYKDSILEHYCSGQFFTREYGITGKEARERAVNGDKEALEMFRKFGHNLGDAIRIISHTFAPEAVVLGGSVSTSFWLFEKGMWEILHQFPYAHVIDHLQIMPATAPDIAIIGAASLIKIK
ncbi:ROK family protein [Candidatus Sulfidibacterium hydrothermale]|uniref:ROK family protein n=1 Tax=Candidatus Sulfidibacterium hydrothermale TaxID=2875962 RepID=UPI001F0A8D9E|nr:ROK family protein [Candidatus Sulfidibacterium hydrothermale]UBM61817.1 ROK family protein [Candidatus Sulfidibacterium hydrothermale]